jgi:c(7)-type cytochrome triheme protein
MPLVRTIAILVVVAAALVALPVPGDAQKVPVDIVYPAGKDSPGPVTFSHESHKKVAEKCTACHTKVFKMKKNTSGNLTMKQMDAGESCGTCHNGKTKMADKVVFATNDKAACEKCHKK